MFIFSFMSGMVETITGGENDENFDPHKHRVIKKPTSNADTMIHLLKGSIGAGILAMPDAVRRMGIIASIIGIIFIGTFATYCIQLLIAAQYKLCKRWKKGYMAYPKSMLLAINDGPPCFRWTASFSYYFADIVLVMWQLGLCVIYIIFVAQNIKQVCDFYGLEITLRIHICYLLLPFILLNLVKDLKLMTPFSTISNLVTIFGLILVFFYLAEDDLDIHDEMLQIKDLSEIPVFIGITLFALEAVGVVLALEYNMENPKDFVGLFGIFDIGMFFIMSLYLLVGIFGYLKYGDDIRPSITLNLPSEQKKAQVAKIFFSIAITLSFPLQNFVAYSIIWRKLQKKIAPKNQMIPDYLLRIMLVVIPWSLAVAIPQLGPFIAFFGAFCLSLLAVVFPGIMDFCLWYPNNYGTCKYKMFRDFGIIMVGIFCLTSGCYTSILDIIAHL